MNAPALITGGAGFIGTNLAHRLLASGKAVLLYDTLARPGSRQNYEWLRSMHGNLVRLQVADIRDRAALRQAVTGVDEVYHLAAQVAVTTSLRSPSEDFDVNARGTLNLLEELRRLDVPPGLLFASTNKVYGSLGDLALWNSGRRWEPVDPEIQAHGVAESQPMSFHTPYGCSKGAADQYVLEYARNFGLRAVVFRMSCVYGPHQSGTEDQGWVAHFLQRAMEGLPIAIYGDGAQSRDLLFVDDLVDAFILAQSNIAALSARAFNIGGGPVNVVSLRDVLRLIEELHGDAPMMRKAPWRPGDQRYFASDTRAFHAETGWEPRVSVPEGIAKLADWLSGAREALAPAMRMSP